MQSELVVWLGRLRELSSIAGAGLPLEESLRLVAGTARELLGFDFCGVLIPDADATALVIAGWSGLSRSYVDSVNTSSPVVLGGTAPSSRAFFSGEPVAVADIETESGFEPWGGVALEQGYHSMISVPLRAAGRVLGTLNGYHTATREYSAAETERLSLLAGYAASALHSASLLDELREANDSLVVQRDLLTRSEEIHRRLLRVSLESGGIDGVVDTLSELIDRPVTMLDPRGEVLAAAREIGRPEQEDAGREVRLGAEVAGRLAIGGLAPLDPIDARAVDHAAVVIALELLRLRAALETEYRIQGELLGDVLLFGVSEQAERRARALGHDLAALRLAVVAEVPGGDPGAEHRRALAGLSALSAVRAPAGSGRGVKPLVAEHQGLLVALWPVDASEGDASRAEELAATRVHAALRAAFPGEPVLVASSGTGRSDLGDAHRVAAGALGLARASGRSDGVITPAASGILGVLLQVDRPGALLEFARRTLGPVLDYDRRRGSDLLQTLRVFLDSGADRTATATALHVHPNTVQQRLRRIESLTGAELRHPSELMAFASAIAAWQVASL
ncbi:helix-turn-helix domain-containing protein [Herbiconiux sp. CPCC 203407]|uniref:Helix-turn-helix domain-containing protein n=1 Tax=Herbiconiux oxytropis TaxID=2970915 RepID=A0AA41XGN5_9MICO|nr:helix-turn-helix domain-containing protein [Herbiconiux oxytropis]MCS5723784.1 helix-turn-helix domain-containing protein [Herbiconiux oxytropis]MCS5725879.1 helix-turn-helix domain-containing protein [Herbiconiux oxytropis]